MNGVIGPLWQPVDRRPGPYRCGCNPTRGETCTYCDGTESERWWKPSDDRDHAIPPCMTPDDETGTRA